MAFPVGWPPRPASGLRSIRFYQRGLATANFTDKAFLFADQATADTYTRTPVLRSGDETTVVHVGDSTKGGSPMGAGPGTVSQPPVPGTDDSTHPSLWSRTILVQNLGGADLEISFDGVNVHGLIPVAAVPAAVMYRERYEAGIAIRGAGATFVITAW